MNGRDDTTTLLPLDSRIGGQNRDSLTADQYLTRGPNKIHIQKGINWGDNKHRHDTTRNRAGKTVRVGYMTLAER